MLVAFNIVTLTWFVETLHSTAGIPGFIAHPIGNALFFVLNFLIQKHFIFGEKK